jgi:hypothetical protein
MAIDIPSFFDAYELRARYSPFELASYGLNTHFLYIHSHPQIATQETEKSAGTGSEEERATSERQLNHRANQQVERQSVTGNISHLLKKGLIEERETKLQRGRKVGRLWPPSA